MGGATLLYVTDPDYASRRVSIQDVVDHSFYCVKLANRRLVPQDCAAFRAAAAAAAEAGDHIILLCCRLVFDDPPTWFAEAVSLSVPAARSVHFTAGSEHSRGAGQAAHACAVSGGQPASQLVCDRRLLLDL